MTRTPESQPAESGRHVVIEYPVSLEGRVAIGHHVVIESGTRIGADASIGHRATIGRNVRIGADCTIGHHVVIHEGTIIGDGVRIDDGASLGKQPTSARNSVFARKPTESPCRIGPGSIIGTGAILYAGCTLGQGVFVADLATVREAVQVGDYTIIGRGVSIENDCTIGRYCKLETNAYVTALSTIEDHVFLAPGILTSNDQYLGRTRERLKHFKGAIIRRGARLGVGSVILPGKEIMEDAVVAAGALLADDAAPRIIHVGIPARPLRGVPDEQLLENQDRGVS